MVVKIIVDAKYCAPCDMLVDAEAIKIIKVDAGQYSVVLTLPSGVKYASKPADVYTVGDLPLGDKPILQWYNNLTFRRVKDPDRPITKTTYFE